MQNSLKGRMREGEGGEGMEGNIEQIKNTEEEKVKKMHETTRRKKFGKRRKVKN